MQRGLRGLLALMLGVAAALVACGDDEEDAATILNVEMGDPTNGQGRITAPTSVADGLVEIRMRNTGRFPHSAQIVRVEGNHTKEELIAYLSSAEGGEPIPEWFRDGTGLGTVAPGDTASAWVTLEEGKHFLWDDEGDPEDQEAPSWAAQGNVTELTVAGKGSGADLPDAAATITARDYAFEAKGLKAGNTTIRFENDGQQFHHVIAAPLAPGKTVDDVRTFFESEGPPTGPPPIDFEKGVGTAVVDSGGALVTEMELTAGNYVMVCFINDRVGGPPHFTKGMLQQVTVA